MSLKKKDLSKNSKKRNNKMKEEIKILLKNQKISLEKNNKIMRMKLNN